MYRLYFIRICNKHEIKNLDYYMSEGKLSNISFSFIHFNGEKNIRLKMLEYASDRKVKFPLISLTSEILASLKKNNIYYQQKRSRNIYRYLKRKKKV